MLKLYIGDTFNELDNVSANDKEDGNLTHKIIVLENTVNINEQGTYKVIYQVTDSRKKTTTKEIKVFVLEKNDTSTELPDDIDLDELLEKQIEGEFYLESLDFNKDTKKFTISGYQIILDQANIDKEYGLILFNKDTEEAYIIKIDKWTENVPYNLGGTYSDSWFKGEIDFTDVPNGDYELYMLAATDDYFSVNIIDNFFNQDIDRRGEDANHGYNFKVLSNLKTQQMELNIRNQLYTTSEAPTYRNMVNEYEVIRFQNNKLHIQGYSYNYNGLYSDQLSINRKLIIENTTNYSQIVNDLGSAKGPYTLNTKDKVDKTYAWYEKEIDISNLEKGIYTLQVYTKTSNAEDYGEISDMFEELNEQVTINGKEYKITYNPNRQNRLELIIK